ncbi:hypothetical protein [Caulobacter segnis]
MRRALIHAVLGPVSAHALLFLTTFTTSALSAPDRIGHILREAADVVPELLTMGQGVVQLLWMALAWIGMLIADARRPRTVIGVVRLAIGTMCVGAPGFVAWMVYDDTPLGALAWVAIAAASLTICRLVSRAVGAGASKGASDHYGVPEPLPDSRAVFGRRGLG